MQGCDARRWSATAMLYAMIAAAVVGGSSRADAFDLKHDARGQMLRWVGSSVSYVVDPSVEKAEELLSLDGIAYGVTFHPDFLKNGYVYVGSNGPLSAGNKTTRVTRYTIARKAPFGLDPKSAKLIIEWPSDGHNGGDLAFGNDGMLYVSSGDGTSVTGNPNSPGLTRFAVARSRSSAVGPGTGPAE